MDERKLDFNAPLLSVRRISAACVFPRRDKQKIIENSPPFNNSDVGLDLATGPVAVPFMWEHIPGKAKSGIDGEFQPNKEAFGKVLGKYLMEKDFENLNPVRSQTGTGSESDDDAYSYALEALSPTDSFSMNCSVSGLSGPDGPVAKPSGAFSTDPQTLDFMMTRFLPAAKAMTLATPQYASRKQSMAPECPKEVKKEDVVLDRKPLVDQYDSIIIPCYSKDDDDDDDEETKDEFGDYKDSGNISRKACGFLPRPCIRNSMCLLDPVPGQKVRTQTLMPSTHEAAKPGKAYMKSNCQIVEKYISNVVHKNKSCCGVQSPGLPENESDISVQSLRLLEDKSDNGVQSPRLSEIRNKMTCGSIHFASSNDQQIMNTSPSKRLPGGARISPYRRERPQSPFRGGGFLGMPKEAEELKVNMLYAESNNNLQELVPYPSTRQGSGSLSPEVEKTLHVNFVNFTENAFSNSNSLDTSVPMDSKGKHSDTSVTSKMLEEHAIAESSVQDIKGLSLSDGKGIAEYGITVSVNSMRSSFSNKPDLKCPVEMIGCFRENGGLDPVYESFEPIKVRAGGNLTQLPPPLLKTPSQSWLKCALQSYRTHFHHEPKIPATDAKWETIVKTSQLHHDDHVRYSEELVTHFSHH